MSKPCPSCGADKTCPQPLDCPNMVAGFPQRDPKDWEYLNLPVKACQFCGTTDSKRCTNPMECENAMLNISRK